MTSLSEPPPLRYDLSIIADWIVPGAKVLDLGCGSGSLLHHLREHKAVRGAGIELNTEKAAGAIAKGLSILQGDISTEIDDYPNNSFDCVILSQTLQQVYEPARLIRQMLRIGRRGIVSFPNFSHWHIRWQLLTTGHAPVSKQLPYQWYDTPNIRVITLKDFRKFVAEVDLRILAEAAINTHAQDRRGRMIRFFPNLRATYGIFMIGA
ncbi:MAG: methionine biosynthesis protein MetW [Desulfobacterales bacterium]|jgi:methionine biosynthesis protein MetW